jgi:hypothetical protein
MNHAAPTNPAAKAEFLQAEPIRYLMQDRNHDRITESQPSGLVQPV